MRCTTPFCRFSSILKRFKMLPLEAGTGYQALVDSFTRLPQTYRAVMEMKLLLGYSDGEIAAKLGLTKTAVNTRISRGRRLLRDIVEQEGFLQDA